MGGKMLDVHRERSSNLELFRIISMLFIVAHHYVVNSGMTKEMLVSPFSSNSLFFFVLGAWGKIGINCFVMITGYFMCKSHITLKKFLKLLLEVEFYKIVIFLVFTFTGYQKFSLSSLFVAIVPVRIVSDGFVSAFLIFFLFIPFINILINNINEKMHLRLIVLLLFLYTFLGTLPHFSVNMNYVSWFAVIYTIASYFRLYPKKVFNNTRLWGILSVLCIIISMLSIFICLHFGISQYYFIADSNKALAVASAVCLFMFFKNLNIKNSKVINTIASASFGVLLIHANSDTMRQCLWRDTLNNAVVFHTHWCYLHFFCSVIGIYIICTSIDLLRQHIIEKPFFDYYEKIFPKIYSAFYKIESKIIKIFNIC